MCTLHAGAACVQPGPAPTPEEVPEIGSPDPVECAECGRIRLDTQLGGTCCLEECQERGCTNWQEEVCDTCSGCDSCCECWTCEGCDERLLGTVIACSECEECPECCNCWTCDECDQRHTQGGDECPCEHCECCSSCCECRHCGHCDRFCGTSEENSENYCSDCGYCYSCCDHRGECERSEGKFYKPPKIIFHPGSKKSLLKGDGPPRLTACELEIAKGDWNEGRLHRVCRNWGAAIVRDSSLCPTGFEICTAPASGDKFLQQIEEITDELRDMSYRVDAACGFHVHVDARDLGHWDIRRLVKLYIKIEDAIFACAPRSRRTSSYCNPCKDAMRNYLAGKKPVKLLTYELAYKDTLPDEKFTYGPWDETGTRKVTKEKMTPKEFGQSFKDRIISNKGQKYHHARYAALNLHSWFYRGTIECRVASGTGNYEKIVSWARLWAAIVEFAQKKTDCEVDAFPETAPWATLLAIAPPDIHAWLEKRKSECCSGVADY